MLKDSIKMSWVNIINNKIRSFLTMLGIIIGVASIIALITIVQAASFEVESQVSSLGADKITIQAFGTPFKNGLSQNDLSEIENIEHVSYISPKITKNTKVSISKSQSIDATIEGKNHIDYMMNASQIIEGRGIHSLDLKSGNKVAIIDESIRDEMFFGTSAIGNQIVINGSTFEIVGVAENETSNGFGASSSKSQIVIPFDTALKSLGVKYINSVDVYLDDVSQTENVSDGINQVLLGSFNYNEDAFMLTSMDEIIETIGNLTNMMSLLLVGIASISLFVGGIGIMNMMLVSVTERTAEIGLRKALGAHPNSIQLQFIIESIVLSIIGGILGLVLGLSVASMASSIMGIKRVFAIETLILAFGFSGIIGVIFGFMPARRASRLNPIDALRQI